MCSSHNLLYHAFARLMIKYLSWILSYRFYHFILLVRVIYRALKSRRVCIYRALLRVSCLELCICVLTCKHLCINDARTLPMVKQALGYTILVLTCSKKIFFSKYSKPFFAHIYKQHVKISTYLHILCRNVKTPIQHLLDQCWNYTFNMQCFVVFKGSF